MQPVYVTQVGAGISPWKQINFYAQQVQIGIGCSVTGQATYTVEYTYEDLNNMPTGVSSPEVFALSSLTDKTTSADSTILWPIAYIRLNVTEGAGTVRMTFVQSDIIG